MVLTARPTRIEKNYLGGLNSRVVLIMELYCAHFRMNIPMLVFQYLNSLPDEDDAWT